MVQITDLQSTQLSNTLLAAQATARQNAVNLAGVLLGDTSNNSNNSSDAVLLNLSPAAQQALNNSSVTTNNNSFTLTSAQQTTITDILKKYQGQPLTDDTFKNILNDLNAAGLSANTLALKDQVQGYSPQAVLSSTLNGDTSQLDAYNTRVSSEAVKQYNYIQAVIAQFQALNAASGTSA